MAEGTAVANFLRRDGGTAVALPHPSARPADGSVAAFGEHQAWFGRSKNRQPINDWNRKGTKSYPPQMPTDDNLFTHQRQNTNPQTILSPAYQSNYTHFPH